MPMLWLAAGLGLVGMKIYKDMNDVPSIIRNAEARYLDEKFKFYEVQKKVLPSVLKLGVMKLNAWEAYGRMFKVYSKIANRPQRLIYFKHTDIRLPIHEIEHLKAIGDVVDILISKGLYRQGTGLLSTIALLGGTMTQELDQETLRLAGFKNVDAGMSVLEKLSEKVMTSELIGRMEEQAVLNSILMLPALLEEGYFKKYSIKKLSKDAAVKIKAEVDNKSMILDDASTKLERILSNVEAILERIRFLRALQLRQIELLEEITKKKTDYNDFNVAEKTAFAYSILLGQTIRKISRIDIIVYSGNQTVIDILGIKAMLDDSRDLIPPDQEHILAEELEKHDNEVGIKIEEILGV